MGDSKEFKNGSLVARCLEAIANRDRADRAMSIDWSALPKVPTPLHSDTEAALEVLGYTTSMNGTAVDDRDCTFKWWQPLVVKYGTDPYMPNYGMPLGPAPEIIKEPPAEIPYSDPPVSQIDRLYQDYLNQQTPGPYRAVYACCGPYCPERPPVTQRKKCYTCGELMSEVKNG